MKPPDYFEKVRGLAHNRWEQLEADPELAGPWRLLFEQVKSPRHVLSELLQNADDAGATWAKAIIQDRLFSFEHNGHDFTEDEFASLCKFGFSNKATLHTIGFRGIGFKSTFSLGPEVRLSTPTLNVLFREQRFTEPIWIESAEHIRHTRISVTITDSEREKELARNLREWSEGGVPLLFFRNIVELEIEGRKLRKRVLGPGPIANSERILLETDQAQEVLLLRSPAEPFPEALLNEIRQERRAPDLSLPPCTVEVVLGLDGSQRPYVVLPTGPVLDLPFSSNGPFLQDPARTGLKSPSSSPTNRWLLRRAGKLVAEAMLEWLSNPQLELQERAEAYRLLFLANGAGDSLADDILKKIDEGFIDVLRGHPVVLAPTGELIPSETCLAPPREAYSIWSSEQLLQIFTKVPKQLLANEISDEAVDLLEKRGWLKALKLPDLVDALEKNPEIPRPLDHEALARLWALVYRTVRANWFTDRRKCLHIVPVQGEKTLSTAEVVVHLPDRIENLQDKAWEFLKELLIPLDTEFLTFLQESKPDKAVAGDIGDARQLLKDLQLDRPSPTDRLASEAYEAWVGEEPESLEEYVHIAHLLAAMNAKVPEGFEFFTCDGERRKLSHGIIGAADAGAGVMLPADWAAEHVLHDAYWERFQLCSRQQWRDWVPSEKSGLLPFVPFQSVISSISSRSGLERFLQERGIDASAYFFGPNESCQIQDYDFPEPVWRFWENCAEKDPSIWAKALRRILNTPSASWARYLECRVTMRNKRGRYSSSTEWNAPSKWVVHLRALPSLEDEFGRIHVPAELYIRTPHTEHLLGVEPFVRAELDTEANRPLLKALGGREDPAGVEKILQRLRALSQASEPKRVLQEILRWYQALDRALALGDTEDLEQTQRAFAEERLILTDGDQWATAKDVTQFPGDEFPDAPVVHPAVQSLSLWSKAGVPERPTEELVLARIQEIPSGEVVAEQEYRRLRVALARYPAKIWRTYAHWLSLSQRWTPVKEIQYRLTMASLVPWKNFLPHVKDATADLQMLPREIWNSFPFDGLKDLASALEYKPSRIPERFRTDAGMKPWIRELSRFLSRVRLDGQDETHRIREQALRLGRSRWVSLDHEELIDVTPYVDGQPAGLREKRRVLWHAEHIYAQDGNLARVFNEVVEELARPFGHEAVKEALKACFERDTEFISDYMAEHFDLEEDETETESPGKDGPNSVQNGAGGRKQESLGPNETVVPPATPPEETGQKDGPTKDKPTKESHPKPPKPSLWELYATGRGYRWDATNQVFVHDNGSRIRKANPPAKWAEYDASGELLRLYWDSPQSLEQGVEILDGVWQMVRNHPREFWLVLQNSERQIEAYSGERLLEMEKRGQIELFIAACRIRTKHRD